MAAGFVGAAAPSSAAAACATTPLCFALYSAIVRSPSACSGGSFFALRASLTVMIVARSVLVRSISGAPS